MDINIDILILIFLVFIDINFFLQCFNIYILSKSFLQAWLSVSAARKGLPRETAARELVLGDPICQLLQGD